MIIILHEITSPRKELLLNLNVIQQNDSIGLFPMAERLLSLNKKDNLLRSAIIVNHYFVRKRLSSIKTYDI